MKTKTNTIKIQGFKVKITPKEGQYSAMIFLNDNKMPEAGTLLSSIEACKDWAERWATKLLTKKEDTFFIAFLDKSKGFQETQKLFEGKTAFEDAKKWGRENLENFNIDMIRYNHQ